MTDTDLGCAFESASAPGYCTASAVNKSRMMVGMSEGMAFLTIQSLTFFIMTLGVLFNNIPKF